MADENRPVRGRTEALNLHLEEVALGNGADGEALREVVLRSTLGDFPVPVPRDVAVGAVDLLDGLRIGVVEVDCSGSDIL